MTLKCIAKFSREIERKQLFHLIIEKKLNGYAHSFKSNKIEMINSYWIKYAELNYQDFIKRVWEPGTPMGDMSRPEFFRDIFDNFPEDFKCNLLDLYIDEDEYLKILGLKSYIQISLDFSKINIGDQKYSITSDDQIQVLKTVCDRKLNGADLIKFSDVELRKSYGSLKELFVKIRNSIPYEVVENDLLEVVSYKGFGPKDDFLIAYKYWNILKDNHSQVPE